jgi:hypothetical protein
LQESLGETLDRWLEDRGDVRLHGVWTAGPLDFIPGDVNFVLSMVAGSGVAVGMMRHRMVRRCKGMKTKIEVLQGGRLFWNDVPKRVRVLDPSGILSAGWLRSRDRRVSLGVSRNRVLPPRPGLDRGNELDRNRVVSDGKLCCLKTVLITDESISVVATAGECKIAEYNSAIPGFARNW